MAIAGLIMYGVAMLGNGQPQGLANGATAVRFKDIGAIVGQTPYIPADPGDGMLEEYHAVVDSIFRRFTVIPAPFGSIFRSPEQVRAWLEMNYIALSLGMHFLEGRCETRVHIREDESRTEQESRADLTAIAAEVFRALRRQAVAAVPLRRSDGQEVMGCAFLIPRANWTEFAAHVQEQARRYDELEFEQTGPWPPYDFVRMQFGG